VPPTVAKRFEEWDRELREPGAVRYTTVHRQINYLADRLFRDYEPTKAPRHKEFRFRLREWLDSAHSEADQKILARLVPELYFIGPEEFTALYRSAMNDPIARWLIERHDIGLASSTASAELMQQVRQTWFCAITDSMNIAAFYHVNNIEGVKYRPAWRTLCDLAEPKSDEIAKYMMGCDPPLTQIVLLEDFVGTGTQSLPTVQFVATLPTEAPVLLCPLIIAPDGSAKYAELEQSHENLTYSPVMELPEQAFVTVNAQPDEPQFFADLRDAAVRLHDLVCGSSPKNLYGPFGFGRNGGLVVLFSNCPDNSLPLLHHSSDSPWYALFPRSSRLL